MRQTVKCKNCGIIWVRVTSFGSELELLEDLVYFCPACHSNWYDELYSVVQKGIMRETTRLPGLATNS